MQKCNNNNNITVNNLAFPPPILYLFRNKGQGIRAPEVTAKSNNCSTSTDFLLEKSNIILDS